MQHVVCNTQGKHKDWEDATGDADAELVDDIALAQGGDSSDDEE